MLASVLLSLLLFAAELLVVDGEGLHVAAFGVVVHSSNAIIIIRRRTNQYNPFHTDKQHYTKR